jgi:heme exporter protein D
MTLLALSWPVAVVSSVAIAAVSLLVAIVLWQTFAIVVRDDRQTERELRLRQSQH